MPEWFGELLAWVEANPGWSYLVVFIGAFAESMIVLGMIVPGIFTIVVAGALVATGALPFWPVCLWAIAGAIAGDSISYAIGHYFKRHIRGLWPFSHYPERLDDGIRFFERYGSLSVAIARFLGPVRTVVPLVAGMMDMSPGRFFFANVLSAFVWAPVYLAPGIVFGASLELAAEASVRLVLLLLMLIAVLVGVIWLAHRSMRFVSPYANLAVAALLRWMAARFTHPRSSAIAWALVDPAHPDGRALSVLAALLILGTLAFAVLAGVTLAWNPAELAINQAALDIARSLRSPPADGLMRAAGHLGAVHVVLPTAAGLYLYLILARYPERASYWLLALALGLACAALPGILPSPDVAAAMHPCGQVLPATVLYGLLAIVLAAGLPLARRWIPYAAATLIVTFIAISHLYFGTDLLTGVLTGLALGTALTAAAGIAFRHHSGEHPQGRSLVGVTLVVLLPAYLLAGMAPDARAGLHQDPAPTVVERTDWQDSLVSSLPTRRQDIWQQNAHPLDLQYAGDLSTLETALLERGWMHVEGLRWGNAIELLSPSIPLGDLPVIPHAHDGHHESLRLIAPGGDGERLVLRLWATGYRIANEGPLWIGNLTAQTKATVLGLLVWPHTVSPATSRRDLLVDDLAASPGMEILEADPIMLFEQNAY